MPGKLEDARGDIRPPRRLREKLYRKSGGDVERQGDRMGIVLALVDDIFFQARISATAKQVGVELKMFGAVEALVAAAVPVDVSPSNTAKKCELIVIDLNARADAIGALERLRDAGNQTPIVAFLSHVQTELAERARAAGCAEVMPRSKFTQDLAAILGRAKK
jgi:DNA-binding NarL/FixJ family response regulator